VGHFWKLFFDPVIVDQILKFARTVRLARHTFVWMIGKEQSEIHLSRVNHTRSVRFDLHSVGDQGDARGLKITKSIDFDGADPARARTLQTRMVA
jgi:hypothetical protein